MSDSLDRYCFCTYFDANFLTRALALYHSLETNIRRPFVLWALCLDDVSHNVLTRLALPRLRLISLADFEHDDEALRSAKQSRSRLEYFWTCTPSLPLFVLAQDPTAPLVTYLDADLFFYADPQPIYDEMGGNSILIIEHRYGQEFARRLKRGIYNVSILAFRRDDLGFEALGWWRERCLEWCYDKVEPNRFADQKYLDDWPQRFRQVAVLQHKGAGLAPWNWMNYRIETKRERTTVDGQPLIFYHFHGLNLLNAYMYDSGLSGSKPMPLILRRWFYNRYVATLRTCWAQVRQISPDFPFVNTSLRPDYYNPRVFARGLLDRQIGFISPFRT